MCTPSRLIPRQPSEKVRFLTEIIRKGVRQGAKEITVEVHLDLSEELYLKGMIALWHSRVLIGTHITEFVMI